MKFFKDLNEANSSSEMEEIAGIENINPELWVAKNKNDGKYFCFYTFDGEGYNPRYEVAVKSNKEDINNLVEKFYLSFSGCGKSEEATWLESCEAVRIV